jgi:hypothetical protein
MLPLLLALLMAPSPAPSADASPLPEIGRVRSLPACDAVRQRILPAVRSLVAADTSIEAGKRLFIDMGRDQVAHLRAAFQLDEMRAGNEVSAIVRAIGVAQALVDDRSVSDAVRSQLRAVIDEQQVAVNELNGTIETELLGRMRQEGLSTMSAVVGPEGTAPGANGMSADEATSYVSNAGLAATPDLIADPRAVEASGLGADTFFGKVAIAVYAQQTHISTRERTLSATVVALQKDCP